MKTLFLYTELAGYNFPCFNELIKQVAEVLIISYPVNKEAPFKFDNSILKVYNRKELSYNQMLELCNNFNPDVICCSGWIDKEYLKICKQFKGKAKRVVSIDNKWTGTLKQRVASLLNFYFIKPYFDYAWVPGESQKQFAYKLGFNKNKILNGFYSADVDLFNQVYNPIKKRSKRFIYSARYYSFKGIENLWQAFIELQNEFPNEWELWCLGTGDVTPIQHAKIKHFGFVQPSNLPNIMQQADVFILPSLIEPWGVVVHEFAAAGFPIICSDKVGAASAFLISEKNGFLFKADDINELKNVIKKMILMSDDEFSNMRTVSHQLAQNITPKKWADELFSIIKL